MKSTDTRRVLRGAAVAAALLALALTGTACGSTGATGTSASNPPVAANATSLADMRADVAAHKNKVVDYPAIPPLARAGALKGKTVWYIPLGSVPFFDAIGSGVQAALGELGVQYHVCSGNFLPTTISACMNQAITQHADAVLTGAVDYKLVPTAFEALKAQHIPVIITNEVNDSGQAPSAALAFDDTTPTIKLLAKLNAESVIIDSDGKAKVLYVGLTDTPQTIDVSKYYADFFAQNCPSCSFAEVDFATASSTKVPSLVSSALIAHPDTDYVIGEIDTHAPDMISGIRTAGFADKVRLSSNLAQVDALQRVKADDGQFLEAGTSANYLGWRFTDGLARMMLGGLPVSGLGVVRVFDKGNVGDLTLTPDAYLTNEWYGSDTFQQTFTKAWGLE